MITSLCTMPVRGTSDDSDRLVTVGPFKFSESVARDSGRERRLLVTSLRTSLSGCTTRMPVRCTSDDSYRLVTVALAT